jgi:hypothetical protein
MTLVVSWFEDGLSPNRIVMMADARASLAKGKTLYTDDAIKLFSIEVRCRNVPLSIEMDERWPTYYSTTFGIGISGDIFEAMTLVEWLRRFFRRLTIEEGQPKPKFEEIADIVSQATTLFRQRRQAKVEEPVHFLVCGYCPHDGQPWAATIECASASNTASVTGLYHLTPGEPWMIGDIGPTAKDMSHRLQQRIQKRRKEYERKHRGKPDADVEVALRGYAMGKKLEQELIDSIADEFQTSIGGPIDKLELVLLDGGAVPDFTADRDAETLADKLPPLSASNLGYLRWAAKVGR